MNPLTCRKLLQPNNASQVAAPLSPTPAATNNSSSSAAAAAYRRQLDSSIALTIIVLLTAFFFIGLLSFFIRRSSSAAAPREGGAEAAASLPVVAYRKQQMTEECAICLSEFEEGETIKLIPYCGHVFHAECLDTWLQLHVTCPLCRSHQLFNKDS
ncbi:RING-H2 finger protein ATL57-like [Salvia miltiorrhiza]|uniref:RING-H2 finger protein ATL57-like n=1 Tax=Salvia miltiorrhiza TaxID=226208 RepID=UPI0025AD504E|nr:RING-H2 finger protein ATL57-like [Salvia miltiorrhiza]